MKKLWNNQRGTAEIVGTVLFLVILLFFFSNVFLWYNNVSSQMNLVMSDKLNALVSLDSTMDLVGQDALKATAEGGRDVQLIRIWIIEVELNNHTVIDLEAEVANPIWIAEGSYMYIILGNQTRQIDARTLEIDYALGTVNGEVRFKILTNLGNTATTHYAESQPPELTAPTYSGISISTTEAGATCYFNITANDNIALSHYIFSTNNTGSWVNDTAIAFNTTPETVSISKILTITVGAQVGYQWFINDTALITNWNSTTITYITTTGILPP
jgi:hypothetical protein